jgi:hypothetical protein
MGDPKRLKPGAGRWMRRYRQSATGACEIITDSSGGKVWPPTQNVQVKWLNASLASRDGNSRLWKFGGVSWRFGSNSEKIYRKGDIVGIKSKHAGQSFFFLGGGEISFIRTIWTEHSRGVLRGGISDITFEDTAVRKSSLAPSYGLAPCLATPGGGPQLGQPDDMPIDRIVVRNHTSEGTGDDAIALFNVKTGELAGNHLNDSFARGIYLYKSTPILGPGNVLERCSIFHDNRPDAQGLKIDDEQAPPPPMPSVAAFDSSFSAPSFDGPSKNMPVGNGEVVANVWVDGVRNGSLALLLGRSDVFSGDVQPLKLGRLRVELEPNPFSSWFTTGNRTTFSQRLDLQRAMILITAGTVHIRVWSDIHGPDSVHVEIDSPGVKTSVAISIDSWRIEPTYVDCRNNARGPCESNLTLPADTFVDDSYYADPYYSLAWYRRNEHSVFASTLTEQKLGDLASRAPDPLMNRTSGAIVIANTAGMAFEHRNATHAVSPKAAERHSLTVFTNTMERVVPRPGQVCQLPISQSCQIITRSFMTLLLLTLLGKCLGVLEADHGAGKSER